MSATCDAGRVFDLAPLTEIELRCGLSLSTHLTHCASDEYDGVKVIFMWAAAS